VMFVYEWQRDVGIASLERAIQINPNNQNAQQWYAMALAGVGRIDDALAQIQRAREIDPLSVIVNANVGFLLYRALRFDEAAASLRHTVAMEPAFAMSRYRLGLALEELGRFDEAIEEFEAMRPDAESPLGLTAIARTRALMGQSAEARRLLGELAIIGRTAYVPAAQIADVHAALGDRERTLEFLEQCVEERSLAAVHLPWDPHWDFVRDDPRFAVLLQRVGL
jgi:tetratricopeptide (TPR) repeat protein